MFSIGVFLAGLFIGAIFGFGLGVVMAQSSELSRREENRENKLDNQG
ncbi:hypothetical protein M0R04_09415 [Candidatus Dojkabacteria bacterium]|jgi:hypothetical protein|nr:hypothetical protein [Candidatus Dojkabacteria bacterium]